MSIKSAIFATLFLACSANAGLVHYNFEGVITSTFSRGTVSDVAGAAKAGQKVNAIYSIDDTSPHNGASGSHINLQFNYATLNYSYYIAGKLVVSDRYRINRLQFAKGWVNGSPTDFIDFTLDGGRDNYSNDYGMNTFGEYVDSYLYMADPTATVFNYLRYNPHLPNSLEFERFAFGVFDVSGISNSGDWFARHDITGIRSDTVVTSAISAPMTGILLLGGFIGLCLKRRKQN